MVTLGKMKADQRPVAVKAIDKSKYSKLEVLRDEIRFMRVRKAKANGAALLEPGLKRLPQELKHPNIIKMVDVFETPKQVLLVRPTFYSRV